MNETRIDEKNKKSTTKKKKLTCSLLIDPLSSYTSFQLRFAQKLTWTPIEKFPKQKQNHFFPHQKNDENFPLNVIRLKKKNTKKQFI